MRLQIHVAIAILMLSLPVFTYAGFPEPDHIFYGTVYVNNTVSTAAEVTAHKMDASQISEANFVEGSYVLRIPIDSNVSALGGRAQAVHSGDDVIIKVDGQEVNRVTISDRRGDLQQLNLSTSPHSSGDLNGDGQVTAFDASQVLAHVVGLTTLSGEALRVADVSANGTVTAYDAALILQYSVGLIDKFDEAGEGSTILAYRAMVRRLPIIALADEQAGQFIMPVQIDEANGGIAYELSFSYDSNILDIQEVRKIHPDDLLEYRVTEGNVKIVLVRAEPIEGRTTEMIVVGTLRPSAESQVSLSLADFQLNEGSIPVVASVLEKPMVFQRTTLGSTNEGDNSSVSIPIHRVIPTTQQENFYSLNSTFQGEPLKKGDVIFARDSDGGVCGYSAVEDEGNYGYMTVYGDDEDTEIDEGAKYGDELTFYINGYRAGSTGVDAPVWRGQWGRKEVDLFTWVEEIPLGEGWNSVSFSLQPHQYSVIETLESIEGQYEVVKLANGTFSTFDPTLTEYSDLLQLQPRQGYWLKSKESPLLAITGVPLSQEPASQASQLKSFSAPVSRDFWGEIWLDGQPAPEGTVITVTNSFGVELGRCVVKDVGKYGFLHIAVDKTLNDIKNADIRFQVEGIPVSLDDLLLQISPSKRDRIRIDLRVE